MINNKNIKKITLGLVAARKGSTGVKNKYLIPDKESRKYLLDDVFFNNNNHSIKNGFEILKDRNQKNMIGDDF